MIRVLLGEGNKSKSTSFEDFQTKKRGNFVATYEFDDKSLLLGEGEAEGP